ncbi:hypothetical protein [Anaeromicropila herbilytica]|uniref:CPBP family intramembrane metalloprotease n=1 Tax=Anaeromicropila herbilytica TaxID=2785025 RepID=A0A7R7ICW6_9FIRM|nr:hypothetical protein [Anaeromicropila herbilytica]BCN30379.1 hypothetical protein bsdtb5_16740 [Anaeromicropila herbilytica]
MNIKKKEASGRNYLELALYAFAGLGIEALYVSLLEPNIYGCVMSKWNVTQSICHWILTCITWGVIAFLIVRYAYMRYGFDIFESKDKIKVKQWILTVVCVALVLISNYIEWNGSKVLHEFQSNGMPKFIFQYIYYLFETCLFMLIIVFGQKAFEKWLHKENIPYGGIVVALTWGMAHWMTKGSLYAGLFTAACGFCFGAIYLLLNRNIKWTYLVLCIMFIL